MLRWRMVASILVGGVIADPTDYRRGPLLREWRDLSLRSDYLGELTLAVPGLPNRYTTPRRYKYEGNTFRLPSTGATIHRYTYKDGLGNTYRGKMESLPGGTVRHRGRWR